MGLTPATKLFRQATLEICMMLFLVNARLRPCGNAIMSLASLRVNTV